MKNLTCIELSNWIKSKTKHLLIDVRESYEVETCSIGGLNIPMSEVFSNLQKIPRDIPVVFHCKSGKRSGAVVHALESKHFYTNLYSLEGGIIAWIENVDQSLAKY